MIWSIVLVLASFIVLWAAFALRMISLGVNY
jgi:hypothetical protein